MPANDQVPCYYRGQLRRVERPAEFRPRAELHEAKRQKLGKFVDSGKVFLFFQMVAQKVKQLWDGPLGIGNLLPFAKPRNQGDKLHYATPMAGDRTCFSRHRRRLIHVSHRSLFSVQILPKVPAYVVC